jgi:WS/DGAT/MGAT family acyltransferase
MDAQRKKSETFSSVDAAWLHMDSPTNLAIITGVLTFGGRMDEARLRRLVERRLLTWDRFRQRVREQPLTVGLPRWEYDPDFDLDYHVQRITLPEPADHAALQQVVGEMMSQPLDRTRPLWRFFLTDLDDGKSALICRLHHCIADGLALVQVLLSTADTRPDEDELPEEEPDETTRSGGWLRRLTRPVRWVTRRVGQTWNLAGGLAHEGMQVLVHPSRLGQYASFTVNATRSLGKLLLIPPDRRTSLKGDCGLEKRAVWSVAIDLDEVKGIGRRMGGTVNDVLISALTGALRRYLELRGDPVDRLNIRGIVPVSLRPPETVDKMGNQFGLIFLSLPIGVRDPLKRLLVLKRRMDAIKRSPEALVAFGILGTMGMTPVQIEKIITWVFGLKCTGVLTNVPGPRQPLYYAGQIIETLMFWVPTPANLGLGVSIISYNGQVIMGVATDAGLIPDPENILCSFVEELEYLRLWGRPPEVKASTEAETLEAGETEPVETEPVAALAHEPVGPEPAIETPAAPFASGQPQPGELMTGELQIEAEEIAPAAAADGSCQALTRSGRTCKNRPLPGQLYCRVHMGQNHNGDSR